MSLGSSHGDIVMRHIMDHTHTSTHIHIHTHTLPQLDQLTSISKAHRRKCKVLKMIWAAVLVNNLNPH